MKKVTFEINRVQTATRKGKQVRLIPGEDELTNNELLLIATRCIQLVGDKQGYDKATEMLNERLYKNRRIKRQRPS